MKAEGPQIITSLLKEVESLTLAILLKVFEGITLATPTDNNLGFKIYCTVPGRFEIK